MLLRLPEWFGRSEAVNAYAESATTLAMLVAIMDRTIAGFLSLETASGKDPEIVVLAVRPEWHRRGIGRQLVDAAATVSRCRPATRLLVRTLGPSHPDRFYAQTRAFYRACGFQAVAETPHYWGPETPSVLLALDLRSKPSERMT
ncbi:MAG: GNAT family N-acetyltransferase [Pseudomonadota bacterium]